jgi:hypothetical protein
LRARENGQSQACGPALSAIVQQHDKAAVTAEVDELKTKFRGAQKTTVAAS